MALQTLCPEMAEHQAADEEAVAHEAVQEGTVLC